MNDKSRDHLQKDLLLQFWQKKFFQERGSIALLSLLIMAAMAAIAVSIAFLTLGEIRSSRDSQSSLAAFYAAESGLERSLDLTTEGRIQKQTVVATLTSITNPLGGSISETLTQNDARYRISSANNTTATEVQFHLGQQKSQQIDLYNPDAPTTPANLRSLKLTWEDDCAGNSWVEVTATEWADIWSDITESTAPTQKYFYACAGGNCAATSNILNTTKSYQVRVKNSSVDLTCNISNMTVRAYAASDAGGDPVVLPGSITLKSEGTHRRTRQILSATLPWQAPVSGLLDFVLFSEQGIVK
ncbi:MAG: hypothetical protein A3B74_02730 [Candidatus Kerfeldbacteria bacterium RIFCSPHIGHO2_02_FULL_42_14]|uniref:Type 4 fimbrial biogenesis protein PilX N-terminal domain-containing protein n=1 Tax=Candidatus Kerfeldbacteria bacterium RIFCSPHIGHO2_02_FULL_42_14 TaxID=1798540 RepID=A0A1G2AS03_9BACT|nr:MAG: hypothetical protein A3B74_02730 [Candidatus Kerfeldbacteria bacterium RIFCSPHIGHO2_02_FULL_42_14]OGY80455.1 MAG: hypothetical protein A3E60_05350 [Candidatus Kerfeldbacteria bacterium RIFCSPHIGHO2_12_FULL_42_13]OGY83885.1 MAG: hypothetical protein A3I91_04875 [Candidatus Kerfeldbacteria bacterium RIFCSPLOWO2_02_FULL_42_19]OGY86576.1 MAG: hypothetical protein A3G01_04955 [Candidatus Kerfeldbacteria bacterium RIFCSPLOWO2_12_FULL_43_9]